MVLIAPTRDHEHGSRSHSSGPNYMDFTNVLVTRRRAIGVGSVTIAALVGVPTLIGIRTTTAIVLWALLLVALVVSVLAGWYATEAPDAAERKANRNVAGAGVLCMLLLWFLNPGFGDDEQTEVDGTTAAQTETDDRTSLEDGQREDPEQSTAEPVSVVTESPVVVDVERTVVPVNTPVADEPTAEELERADAAMKVVIKRLVRASDLDDHGAAFDAARLALTEHEDALLRADIYATMVRSQYTHGFSGLHEHMVDNGGRVDQVWLDRAQRMPPPDPREFKECLFHYGLSRICLANHHLLSDQFGDAQLSFTAGEQAIAESDDPLLGEAEIQTWLRQIRTEFAESINQQGSEVGTYVTNTGLLQKWIGRVIGVRGRTITVRITWSNSAPDFRAGQESTFIKDDECKPLKAVCIDAMLSGYK